MSYYRALLIRLAVLLGVYTFLRFIFFQFNSSLFEPLSIVQWIDIYYGGLRFDISTLFIVNSLYILIWIFPISIRSLEWVSRILKWLFVVSNSICIAIMSADLAFYPFNGKRIDSEIIGLLNAVPKMAGSFLKDYWYVFSLFALLVVLVIKMYDMPKPTYSEPKILIRISIFIVSVFLVIIGIRGGLTNNRPLSVASGSLHASSNHIALVTNSAYTLIFSLVHRDLVVPNHYSSASVAEVFPVVKSMNYPNENQPNVVLIIMEGFSKSFVGGLTGDYSYTPNIDTLLRRSTYFTNGFANGRRSSQALVALSSGIPALMNEPFMYSSLAGNRVDGVPKLLNAKGYSTAFFNGSSKEMLGWEEYIQRVGFKYYYNKETYPFPEHDDGHWGIYDHYMFDYLISTIDTTSNPFFYTLFSISSHHPFNIPDSLKGVFRGGSHEVYQSIEYADWSLGRFLKKASSKSWFKNTVFIITADHTFNGDSFSDSHQAQAKNWLQNRVGLYAIPILFYHPTETIEKGIETPFSHVDVSATILEFTNYSGNYLNWGVPFSDLSDDNCAIHFVNGIYQICDTEHVLLFDGEKTIGFYAYKTDYAMTENLMNVYEFTSKATQFERKLKAAIQQHHSRMVNNFLFVRDSK